MKFLSSARWLSVSLLVLVAYSQLFTSCNSEDVVLSGSAVQLEFSRDTVLFDTVFTSIGSTTQYFTVINPSKTGTVQIDEIRLAGGEESNYRLNVDGRQSNEASLIQIRPQDSLFIFVEVTLDPTGNNLPVLITDSILFMLGSKQEKVQLMAFGQDYHYIDNSWIPTQTWTNDKPYVIYNSMGVDYDEELTIEAGCQLYFHKNSSLFVRGTLKVQGTTNEPVVFQGDRLESLYDEIPGQWGYIHFLPGSKYNEIDWAIIKNSVIGIQVDTFATIEPCLRISNTQIRNMTAVGLLAQGSKVSVDNTLFANCGQYAVVLSIGGEYNFNHCTIGNYYQFGNRVTPSLVLNNYYEDVNGNFQVRALENAYFNNCIIYGSNENELVLDKYPNAFSIFNYHFENCLIRIEEDKLEDSERMINCILNQDPAFYNSFDQNFALTENSPARSSALVQASYLLPFDLSGRNRLTDGAPDVGAFEWFVGDGDENESE